MVNIICITWVSVVQIFVCIFFLIYASAWNLFTCVNVLKMGPCIWDTKTHFKCLGKKTMSFHIYFLSLASTALSQNGRAKKSKWKIKQCNGIIKENIAAHVVTAITACCTLLDLAVQEAVELYKSAAGANIATQLALHVPAFENLRGVIQSKGIRRQ